MKRYKHSFFALLLCFLLVVSAFCGCNTVPSVNDGDNNSSESEGSNNSSESDGSEVNDTAVYYTLTVQDSNGYIIVELQEQYKAGEEVTVTTELSDEAIGAYLDGVFFGLGVKNWRKIDSQFQFCMEYYFVMPSHDAVLSFSPSDFLTKNGIPLSEDVQTEIKTAFYDTYKDKYSDMPFEQLSLRCYGAFEGVYVIFEDGIWDVLCVVTSEKIADVIFTYPDSLKMTVYCDGAFYTLAEAYEKNILSYDNLLTTHETYKACNGSIYAKDEEWPQNIES